MKKYKIIDKIKIKKWYFDYNKEFPDFSFFNDKEQELLLSIQNMLKLTCDEELNILNGCIFKNIRSHYHLYKNNKTIMVKEIFTYYDITTNSVQLETTFVTSNDETNLENVIMRIKRLELLLISKTLDYII